MFCPETAFSPSRNVGKTVSVFISFGTTVNVTIEVPKVSGTGRMSGDTQLSMLYVFTFFLSPGQDPPSPFLDIKKCVLASGQPPLSPFLESKKWF
jgi:hypothetical protein